MFLEVALVIGARTDRNRTEWKPRDNLGTKYFSDWGQSGKGEAEGDWSRVHPEAAPDSYESKIQIDNCAMV